MEQESSGTSFLIDEQEQRNPQLYTPAMLAEVIGVSVRAIRRWHEADLLEASKIHLSVPLFAFDQVAAAKQLAKWTKQGVSVQSICQQLSSFKRLSSEHVPLAQLPIYANGKKLLLRQEENLLEATGQLHFGFGDAVDEGSDSLRILSFEASREQQKQPERPVVGQADSLSHMLREALVAEDAEELGIAVDWYRAALATHGPNADVNFQMAELLYRMNDPSAARERYFAALEIDGSLVEARANLGCLLAENGQLEMALAAFEGALRLFPDYADVHFHLARLLDDIGERAKAVAHWEQFLRLAPSSPWADEAAERLSSDDSLLDF